jgi:hypothetical protein
MVPVENIEQYQTQGFAVARGLFSAEEADFFSQYFTDMVERGGDGWAEGEVDPENEDPLRRYPRLLQPHRGDQVAFNYMVDPRVREHLAAYAGADPFAVQTMVYFKPPGARGQNLHQDNTYLKAKPGTCHAAWMALDDCTLENGCMHVVPGTQDLEILCQVENPGISAEFWGDWETPIPDGLEVVPVEMKKGDVLFFNGSVIHGSHKNRSEMFRRTLIGHYVAAESHQVSHYYFPIYTMDGQRVDEALAVAPEGGPCGVYVERDGVKVLEMVGEAVEATAAH